MQRRTMINGLKSKDRRKVSDGSVPLRPASEESVLAQIAALQTMKIAELRALWRELSGGEAPGYNRTYISNRLAYRIQELAFGGLKSETRARLDALADEIDRELKGDVVGKPKRPVQHHRPVAGTRLVREWRGVEHCVTVLGDGRFEYQGRPYTSLSALAYVISGTRWNGWTFFGLKRSGTAAPGATL